MRNHFYGSQEADMDTYYESAEGVTITRQRARQELQTHGLAGEWGTFLDECGDSEAYDAQAVLDWLGY